MSFDAHQLSPCRLHPKSWTSGACRTANATTSSPPSSTNSGGRTFVIVNDHDPKPLRYQAEALSPGRFTWSYLEAGPHQWRVEITRAG